MTQAELQKQVELLAEIKNSFNKDLKAAIQSYLDQCFQKNVNRVAAMEIAYYLLADYTDSAEEVFETALRQFKSRKDPTSPASPNSTASHLN